MSKFFGDIGKDSRDLFTDDFPSDGSVKFTTQSKTPEGVTAKATTRRFLKGGREQIESQIEPKIEFKEKNIEVSGKFSTTNDYTANVVLKDIVLKGSKIEVSGNTNEKSASSKIVISHKINPIAAKLTATFPLDSPKKSGIKFNGDVVLQYPENLHVGGNFFFDLNEKSGLKCEGVVGYNQSSWQFAARGSYSPPTKEGAIILLGFSFFHKLSNNLKWALDFDTDHVFKRGPVSAVVGEYKVDDHTTVKGKLTVKVPDTSKFKPETRVALSTKQNINQYLSFTLGADLNVRQFLYKDLYEGNHSFGLDIKLQE